MSRPEGGLILIMLFRILKNVIACLIIRLRSRVCQLSVSTRLVGSIVLNSFEVNYVRACMCVRFNVISITRWWVGSNFKRGEEGLQLLHVRYC